MSKDFKKVINTYLPWNWETVLGWGMSYYLSEQDPDNVYLDVYDNGYAIAVTCDEEKAKEAVEFWNEYVKPRLNGNE